MALLIFGILAGGITTVAGMGGGMLLVLGLSALWADPTLALAVTSPALLVGNLHRVVLFRRDIDLRRAGAFVAAVGPGALAGALLTLVLSPWLVQLAMVVAASLAVARGLGLLVVQLRAVVLVPAGLGVGVVSASGGAGPIAAPILMALGLTGAPYVGTMAASAVCMHTGRILAYGFGGWLDDTTLARSAVLAVGLAAGNLLGRHARGWVPEAAGRKVEVGMAVSLALLAVVGLARSL